MYLYVSKNEISARIQGFIFNLSIFQSSLNLFNEQESRFLQRYSLRRCREWLAWKFSQVNSGSRWSKSFHPLRWIDMVCKYLGWLSYRGRLQKMGGGNARVEFLYINRRVWRTWRMGKKGMVDDFSRKNQNDNRRRRQGDWEFHTLLGWSRAWTQIRGAWIKPYGLERKK